MLCGTALLLTACGAQEDGAEKEHYYEVLDSTGAVLYTVEDGTLTEAFDGLLGTPAEDMELSEAGADIEPLYTYAYWQEKTLLAGEDPDGEREYEELMRVLVPAEGENLVIQVLPDVDTLEGLGGVAEALELDELLTFTVTAPEDTVKALRRAEYFIKNDM